jgi:sodium-dependent dicarboxylate transporter 2/3/5
MPIFAKILGFAASIGGTGTLIGTGPNIVLNAFLNNAYGADNPVTFASFMLYALPQTLILIVVCWLWLQALFIGFRLVLNLNKGHSVSERRIYSLIVVEGPVNAHTMDWSIECLGRNTM